MLTRSAILVLAEKRTQEMCKEGELGFTPQEAREHNHCLTCSLDWWSTNLFGSKSSLWRLSVPFSARWFLLDCLWLHSSLRQILPWFWWFRCPLLEVLCNIFLWSLVVLFEKKKARYDTTRCTIRQGGAWGGRGRAKTLAPTRIHQSHHSYSREMVRKPVLSAIVSKGKTMTKQKIAHGHAWKKWTKTYNKRVS